MAGRQGPLEPYLPFGQPLGKSHSLPALGSAKTSTEGNRSGLPKGVSPSGGLEEAGFKAEHAHLAQQLAQKGGWRGQSEQSRAQEVCRHLEWARGMKAAYDRQVHLYEKELESHEQAAQPSRSSKRHQRKQLPQEEAKQQMQAEMRSFLEDSSPKIKVDYSHPTAKSRRSKKGRSPVHFSRRPREDPCVRSRSMEPKRQVPATPSSLASAASQEHLPRLKLVNLPGLRMQAPIKEELREDGSPARNMVISHLLQVQLNPAALEQQMEEQMEDVYEDEDYSPPEPPIRFCVPSKPSAKCEQIKSPRCEIPPPPEMEHVSEVTSPAAPVEPGESSSLSSPLPKQKHKYKQRKTWHANAHAHAEKDVDKSPRPEAALNKQQVCKILDIHMDEGFRKAEVAGVSADATVPIKEQPTGFSASARGSPRSVLEHAGTTRTLLAAAAGAPPASTVAPPTATTSRFECCTTVFRRLRYDGEVHKDQLPLALELAGFPKPNRTWIADVVQHVTEYSTLNLDEFIYFAEQYADREHEEAHVLFDLYDVDKNRTIDIVELSELFESCGITPMGHVIREILKEVGCTANALSFEQFWQVLLHIRSHEGFTQSEVADIKEMFNKFDVDKSGGLSSKELSRVLRYLGFALEPEVVDAIVSEVDVDSNGTLDEHEFFVCMRKVRERELSAMKQIFKDCDTDHSGTINHAELVHVLRKLGYYPEQEEINDAAEDAGVGPGEEMNFGQLWRFLVAYRGREGFSKADVTELQDCLAEEAVDGELDAVNVGHLFVKLGLPVTCTQVQRFVANVDIDGSGTIDFSEFIKIGRQLSQHISTQAGGICTSGLPSTNVSEMLEAVVPVSYQTDVTEVTKRFSVKGSLDQYDIVSSVKQLRKLTRRQVQANSGFGQHEMEVLREQFTEYDRQRMGTLSDPQVQRLLENLFPDLATSASSRSKLLEIMQEATKHAGGAIDFPAFVKLMRNVKDLAELDRIKKETEIIKAVNFSADEVNEFREFFLGSIDREFLSLGEAQEILSAIVPMGAKNTKILSQIFSEVVPESHGGHCDFSEFLLLMRRLMDCNFAGINEFAEKIAYEGPVEHCQSDCSMSKDQARKQAKELLGAFKRGSGMLHKQAQKSLMLPEAKRVRHRSFTC